MTETAQAATVSSNGCPVASLGELQRAWEAVLAGRFRTSSRLDAGRETTAPSRAAGGTATGWFPAETVIPVIGAGGGVGATTLALALAAASTAPARVVECCSASASGLAAASTAELGATDTGWRRGLRDGAHHRVLLERAAGPITTAAAVPLPTDPDRPVAVTFLDCGWDLDHLLSDGWLAQLVTAAPALVVAATATIPGLRRLEVTLAALGADQVHVGVLGPRRKKWGRPVEGSLGAATRALDTSGALVEIPLDRALATHGLTSAPLPQPLLNAASQLLDRLHAPATPRPAARPQRRPQPPVNDINR
jgi:hypothetical protein